jgi:subtilisin family serine protease
MDHGTAVAAVAAHMAPGADLIAIRVDEDDGSIPADNVVAALDHLVCRLPTLANPAAAVCISLAQDPNAAGGGHASACDATSGTALALAMLIDDLWAADAAVVVAAGNYGLTGELSFPACIDRAIAAGATTDLDLTHVDYPTRWDSSNWSADLDLVAPGEYVTFTVTWSHFPFTLEPGTSIAAPLVAGAFALLRQAFPHRSVGTIRAALRASATPIPDPAHTPSITAKQIFVSRARTALESSTPPLGASAR